MHSEFDSKMKSIYEKLSPHVAIIVLLPHRGAGPEETITNGTVSFVDTGEEKILITCSHVYAEFISYRSTNPDAIIAIGGNGHLAIDISDSILIDDGGSEFDVATLKLVNPDDVAQIGKSYFKVKCWPPDRPIVGETALAVGFPGKDRHVAPRGLITHAATICDPITSVTDRNIILADEFRERAVSNTQWTPEEISFGGMSGSVVYVFDEIEKNVKIVGVFYEAHDGLDSMIFIAHASYIDSNGKISWGRMPFC